MFLYFIVIVFVVLPGALLLFKKVILPALSNQQTPEQRLEEANKMAAQAELELKALEAEEKANRLRLQLELRQRQSTEQLIEDLKNNDLTAFEDKRKEKNGRVKD